MCAKANEGEERRGLDHDWVSAKGEVQGCGNGESHGAHGEMLRVLGAAVRSAGL